MTARPDRLVREIAALLQKYSVSDWELASSSIAKIAQLAKELSQEVPKKTSRRTSKRSTKKILGDPVPDPTPRAEELVELRRYLRELEPPPSMQRLRDIATRVGMKGEFNKNRKALYDDMIQYLDGLSDAPRADKAAIIFKALQSSGNAFGDEYARWASLIMRGDKS